MKGFLVFLGITMLLMGAYIYYNIKHPQDTIIVRKGAYWITLDHNVSKK
ncbi:MAG: hypothetical protein L3J47_03470 [Sulfurovum sp.]|nr:hypothetical protein [Sulfurovum sp.]